MTRTGTWLIRTITCAVLPKPRDLHAFRGADRDHIRVTSLGTVDDRVDRLTLQHHMIAARDRDGAL